MYKSIKFRGNQMSCVPPQMYADRFVDFMKKSLVVNENADVVVVV
jgi:hypothetical protein